MEKTIQFTSIFPEELIEAISQNIFEKIEGKYPLKVSARRTPYFLDQPKVVVLF